MTDPLTTNEVGARLRRLEKRVETGGHYGFQQDIWKAAADTIDRMIAENARLSHWHTIADERSAEIHRLTAERDALKAENARLREALIGLIEKEWQVSPEWTTQSDMDDALNAALAALGEKA